MAEKTPRTRGLLAELLGLGGAFGDLARAVQGKPAAAADKIAGSPAMAALEQPILPELPPPTAQQENSQLLNQHTPGWHIPVPSKLPVPSYAPAMTAFGIVFLALGAITIWVLCVLGAIIFVLGIAKWIGELLHD